MCRVGPTEQAAHRAIAYLRAGRPGPGGPDGLYLPRDRQDDRSLAARPNLERPAAKEGCQLALEYGVTSVCILPYYLRRSAQLLDGSAVGPSTTIGFPRGGHTAAQEEVT